MAVRKKIPYKCGIFYITITCAGWIPLFEITNGYDFVYKFFDILKPKGHFVNAYVIMSDHVHAMLSFRHTKRSISRIIGDDKRFTTYNFIDTLEKLNKEDILNISKNPSDESAQSMRTGLADFSKTT